MSDAPIRLLHITDPHLHAHRDAMMRGLNTFETFKAVVEHVQRRGQRPDAIIATGDLVQDETRQGYELFRDLVIELDAPVHCVPGNHDSPRIMADVLNTPPFHFCGSAVYDNWCLIMLNSTIRWDDGGRLENSQLEFLQRTLNEHRGKFAFVGMHHHPLPMGSHWLDGLNLRNSDEFFEIIDQYPNVKAVVWGHVHQASERKRNGVTMLSTPSTGSQFLPGSDVFMMDARPPGYRWISLMPDGSVETEVVWLA